MDSEWTNDGQNHFIEFYMQGVFLTFLGGKKLVLKNSKHRLMGPFLIKMDFGPGRPQPFSKIYSRGLGHSAPEKNLPKRYLLALLAG